MIQTNITLIKKWHGLDSINESYRPFIKQCHQLLLQRIALFESFDVTRFSTMSFEQLVEENHLFYAPLINDYDTSYANPRFLRTVLPERISDIGCSLYQNIIRSIQWIFQGNNDLFDGVLQQFLHFVANVDNPNIYQIMQSLALVNLDKKYSDEIQRNYDPCNFASTLINNVDLTDIRYLFRYGVYIDETEIAFAQLMATFDKQQINDLAKQMVDGYLKGFKRHNKNMKDRKNSRIICLVGLEKIAFAITNLLKDHGYCGYVGELVYRNLTSQASKDYDKVNCFALDESYYKNDLAAYKNALAKYESLLSNYQGNIIMVAFGHQPFTGSEYHPYLNSDATLVKQYSLQKRLAFETYVPKAEVSYTGMAFPVKEIDPLNYETIFVDVMKINKMDPKQHEIIQQQLIDILDLGEYVHIQGFNGNKTDIKVYLHTLNDPNKETNFVNCGADVNIPAGEVYTTPQLDKTNGIIHLQQIRIAKIQFQNVMLTIHNGYVTHYSCDGKDKLALFKEVVMRQRKQIPLGEFALGTNTYAYHLAKKNGILHSLHTLIYEKLGPHIAIGDTCFAWAEDSPLYGENGKLMIAKDNEFSIQRKENPQLAYVNQHNDLTIPYDEIGHLYVHTRDNKDISIVKNGLFCIDACEPLNQYLR